MVLWLAAIDAALLVVALVRISRHLWVLRRSERARDAELAESGLDIAIVGPTANDFVVLGEVDGMSVHSAGFDIATTSEAIHVPRGTIITLAREPIVRDGKALVPVDARMRAVFTRAPRVDDGPLRTSDVRTTEGPMLLAPLEATLRNRSALSLSWVGIVLTGATVAFAVVLAPHVTWLATTILSAIALGLTADLVTHMFVSATMFLRERTVEDDGDNWIRKIAAFVGTITTLVALSLVAPTLPKLEPWSIRHAPVASPDHVDPALDGRIVVITAPIFPLDRIEDSELLTAGDELVLDREVSVGTWQYRGRGGQGYGWTRGRIGELQSLRWSVTRARIGVYELAFKDAKLFTLDQLPVASERVRRAPDGFHWEAQYHHFSDATADAQAEHRPLTSISFSGLASGTRVTVVAKQRGNELVAIDNASDGTTGITILETEPQHGESLRDDWPDDQRFILYMSLVALGVCFMFMRPLHLLSGFILVVVLCIVEAAGGGGLNALPLVPILLMLMNAPLSIPIACGAGLMLAAPIAIMRATESVALAQLAVIGLVALAVVARVSFGWHRSLGWEYEQKTS